MAYDEYQAERITRILEEARLPFFSKKMMGGLVFMVNEKMACGLHFDKKQEKDLLMVRIGEEAFESNNEKTGFSPMAFTGRTMKGYAFISPEGYDTDEDLQHWINLCIDFNPFTKASKKRKPQKPK